MAVQKVNAAAKVVTSSFGQDNYARRLLKKAAAVIDNNADELDHVANILAPMQKIGVYESAVGETFPTAGISWADFTAESGASLTGARGLMITIEGISVGTTTTHGNKQIGLVVYDTAETPNTLITLNDSNSTVAFEAFKVATETTGEIYGTVSGRAPESTTAAQAKGFYTPSLGLDDGTIFPATAVSIGDFLLTFGTNRLTQNRKITITAYAQY
jgi:hypothetical protein